MYPAGCLRRRRRRAHAEQVDDARERVRGRAMWDVLVVDDDAGVRDFIGLALEAAGITARTAAHGERALERVAERRPGVILLDRDMPVMNGEAFCDALDATLGRDGTAVVAMTASTRAVQFRDACHADDLLAKPFDLDDLSAVVDRHLPADRDSACGRGASRPPLPRPTGP
jgi:CheY-like chemotaxis protein